jgi:hypothetical protein
MWWRSTRWSCRTNTRAAGYQRRAQSLLDGDSELDLNRKIFEFRQQLQNPGSNPLPLAQELYKIVFPEGLRQDLDT